uniref:HMG box domain-containing protein n=1 Tax=Quercus lobata TaxID=97700 RepID=A0A7N2M314_QUELO
MDLTIAYCFALLCFVSHSHMIVDHWCQHLGERTTARLKCVIRTTQRQNKDLRVGNGPIPKMGETVVKSSSTVPKAKKAKTDKKSKDPNAPKRPQTAFFLFMDDFRKTYKEENPDSKGGKEVAKEGGEKWKSLDRKREKYS